MGLQKTASYYAIASYWFIAIPVASLLSFYLKIGVDGLIWGMIVGVFF